MGRGEKSAGRVALSGVWSDTDQPLPRSTALRLLRNTTMTAGVVGLVIGSVTGAALGGLAIAARHALFARAQRDVARP